MKNQMDAVMLKDYQRRWQAVRAAEAAAQQETPLVVRWQQLNSIIRLAAALGLSIEAVSKDVDDVRYRWNTLKNAYAISIQG